MSFRTDTPRNSQELTQRLLSITDPTGNISFANRATTLTLGEHCNGFLKLARGKTGGNKIIQGTYNLG